MRIFMTGGSGFAGAHLIRHLLGEGHQVSALARSSEAADKVRALGAVPVRANLDDAEGLSRALEGAEAVVHAAAMLSFFGKWSDFVRTHVAGTRNLVAAARKAGVKRFINIGAASCVMAVRGPMLRVSEIAPYVRDRVLAYSTTKGMAEEIALAASDKDLTVISLRPPMIWGPGDAFERQIAPEIVRGRFMHFARGDYPYTACHIANLCHAVSLAHSRGTGGRAYFISDGAEEETARSFITARCEAMGIAPPARSIAPGIAWRMAGMMEAAWRMLRLSGEPPITREMVRLIGWPFTLNLTRAAGELGYAPVISRAQGLLRMRPIAQVMP